MDRSRIVRARHRPHPTLPWRSGCQGPRGAAALGSGAEQRGRRRALDHGSGAAAQHAELSAADRIDVQHLQRALELRTIGDLERQGKLAEAARRLDALLAEEPQDRQLRVKRADLYLLAGRFRTARDRYAVLVAEDPDDLDTRLAYVRALTESGDIP